MADRYDMIAERRRMWEALDRMPPVDAVFRKHAEKLMRDRGIEPLPGMYEAKEWRPEEK